MKTITLLILMMMLFLLLGSTGCSTYQLPPVLSAEQKALLLKSPFSDVVLGVQVGSKEPLTGFVDTYELNNFIVLFKQSGLFKEVNIIEKLKHKPNLIAVLEAVSSRFECGTGAAAMTIMTLGIIPVRDDNQTYFYRIMSPKLSDGIPLKFTYIKKSYFGSLVSLLNFSSSWSRTPQTHRNIDLFAYELVTRKEDVLKLVDRESF